jgi:acyl CoA:acetate/3-ketoacid CoA transferase beta subunit
MYAVVGATGNTGRAVVKELKGLGENPVCVVRNADKAKEVLGADTKTAVAELDDRAGLEKALAGAKRVFIAMEHATRDNQPKIVKKCTLPLTGVEVVDHIVTELAFIDVTPEGLLLRELDPDATLEQVQALTESKLLLRAGGPARMTI